MSALRTVRLKPWLPRLGAALLALVVLAPGQALLAAGTGPRQPVPQPGVPAQPAVDQPPVAHNDNEVAFANEEYQELYVLDNDSDPDVGDRVTVKSVGFSQHGSTDNNFWSIPYGPLGFVGTDHFNYIVRDLTGLTATAKVTVTVVPFSASIPMGRFAVYSGPFDSTRWTISPYAGTNGSNASNGQCDNSAGLGVQDAQLDTPFSHYNAFDNGMTIWVNNTQLVASPTLDVTHHSLVSGPTNIGGLRVYVHYYGLPNSNTLRTLVEFINLGGTAVPVTATLASNLGTDQFTVIPAGGTSSGDATFGTNDRWVVTSDDLSNPGEIVDTHVLFGPNSPPVTPELAATTVFACRDPQIDGSVNNDRGLRSRFVFSVPGSHTSSLLFFNQAHDTNTGAVADAQFWFDHDPVGLLEGLSSGQMADVVNWKLTPISRIDLPLLRRNP